jgi:decaprenylphospho-beta-D-erythro-pentofuranosid-2-ulose 2-reductase
VGPTLDDLFADADYDLVLCAIGVLDDDERHLEDSDAAYSTITGTFAGPALAVLAAARGLRSQGHGTLATITSVAAIRPRAGVALYGGAKAGLDFLARGLRPTLREHGVRVLVIRPGFVHTRMTEGLSPAPLSTDPESVARDIVRSLRRSRTVVWTPRLLRPMFAVLRLLPSPVWNRLAAR